MVYNLNGCIIYSLVYGSYVYWFYTFLFSRMSSLLCAFFRLGNYVSMDDHYFILDVSILTQLAGVYAALPLVFVTTSLLV